MIDLTTDQMIETLVENELDAIAEKLRSLDKENKVLRQQLDLAEAFIPQQAKILYQRAWNEYD